VCKPKAQPEAEGLTKSIPQAIPGVQVSVGHKNGPHLFQIEEQGLLFLQPQFNLLIDERLFCLMQDLEVKGEGLRAAEDQSFV
jgi:hypothetical protein